MMSDAAIRLDALRSEIDRASRLAKRESGSVELIAVAKRRTAAEIQPLLDAGLTSFGENRVEEASEKWSDLRAARSAVRLHMIGRLQSNKSEQAVALFDTIHSLDRPSLLSALVAAGDKAQRFPSVYVQVNIGDEAQKGGVPIDGLPALLAAVRASPLALAGLMGMPPRDLEPGPYFALLAELARRHDVSGLSMGMSSDFRTAIMLGATAIRIGSALFD